MLYGKTENTSQDKPDIQGKPQSEDKSQSGQKLDIPNFTRRAWDGIHPDNKRRIVIACLVFIAVAATLAGYKFSGRSFSGENVQKPVAENKMREIDLDKKMVEKGLYESTRSSLAHQNNELEKIKFELEKLKETPPVAHKAVSVAACTPSQDSQPVKKEVSIPPPPNRQPIKEQNKRKSMYESPPPPPYVQESGFTGGISFVSNNDPQKNTPDEGKKKEEQTIYLPPSFMEATLLSGLAAPTTSAGKNNPLPILMRIKDLAVLPNQIKANLKGCFLIAEGVGNLADERVHARLLTLSCLSKKGSCLIDQSVKGFIVDSDGKVGLKGMVTAKMGSMLARSALTGFLGGIGDAIDQSSLTSSFSTATGANQQWFTDTDAKNISRAGAGKGISNAMKDLQKFYLQLAEQTMPVIEVGATKTVTAVISEGVMLKIKENPNPGGA